MGALAQEAVAGSIVRMSAGVIVVVRLCGVDEAVARRAVRMVKERIAGGGVFFRYFVWLYCNGRNVGFGRGSLRIYLGIRYLCGSDWHFERDCQSLHKEEDCNNKTRKDVHGRQREGKGTPSLPNACSGRSWKLERGVRARTMPTYGLI